MKQKTTTTNKGQQYYSMTEDMHNIKSIKINDRYVKYDIRIELDKIPRKHETMLVSINESTNKSSTKAKRSIR